MTRRYLSDASTLIALAACGRLPVLRALTSRVHVTPAVLREALVEKPGAAAVRGAVDEGWIVPIKGKGTLSGLGPGEASLILVAKRDDVLILDDRAARLEAKSRGLRVAGLLGLLVHGVRTKKIRPEEALATLDALAAGSFRMTSALYAWAHGELSR